jgi:hypothetical protein
MLSQISEKNKKIENEKNILEKELEQKLRDKAINDIKANNSIY